MTTIQATDTPLFDVELVTYRLEEAGAALLALPGTGWSTRLRASSLEIVRTAIECYGWTEKRIRPPIPSATRITRRKLPPARAARCLSTALGPPK